MKAEQLIDVGSITPKLLNPHLRRAIFGAGGGTTVVNTTEEPDKVPIYICRLVSDVDILLDGTVTTLDGTTIAEGDSVLVTGQTNLWENGIYFAFTTGWVRFTGIKPAMLVTISEGTDYSDSVWILTSNTIIVGTDDIVFEKVLPISSVADGTVTNSTLRWDSTDWVETIFYRIRELIPPSLTNIFNWYNSNETRNVELNLAASSINFTLNKQSSTYFASLFSSISQSLLSLGSGSGNTTKVEAPALGTTVAIEIKQGNVTRFKVLGSGSMEINNTSTGTFERGVSISMEASNLGNDSRGLLVGVNNGIATEMKNSQSKPTLRLYKIASAINNYNVLEIVKDTSYLGDAVTSDKINFSVKSDGDIFSNSLTANTYLGANASKEIVSIPNPNTILTNIADKTDTTGVFTDADLLEFIPETNITYELTFKLAFGDTATREGSVRLYAGGTTFTFRPFVVGNFGAGAPAVIYLNDYTAVQPFNMDDGTPLDFELSGTYGIFELKGIFKTTIPIANLKLQFKTREAPLPITLKAYSYMKISR